MEKTILFSTWVIYLLVHYFLVSDKAKGLAANYFGMSIQQTRKATSVISLLLITSLLQYHFYVYSPTLYTLGLVYRLIGIASMATGIVFIIRYIDTLMSPPQPFEATTLTDARGRNHVKSLVKGNLITRIKNPGYTGALFFALGFPLYFNTFMNTICASMAAIYVLAKLIAEDKRRQQALTALKATSENGATSIKVPVAAEQALSGNVAVAVSALPASRPGKLRVHKMIPYTKRSIS
jgi:protein-S-isoprenylcysteine O-methyltransferase Ste14